MRDEFLSSLYKYRMKSLESFLCTFAFFCLFDLCSLKRFKVEPKTLLDTSVVRRNYGILIRGSHNVSDLTQLWDLGLSNVLCVQSLLPGQFSQTQLCRGFEQRCFIDQKWLNLDCANTT